MYIYIASLGFMGNNTHLRMRVTTKCLPNLFYWGVFCGKTGRRSHQAIVCLPAVQRFLFFHPKLSRYIIDMMVYIPVSESTTTMLCPRVCLEYSIPLT